MPSNPADRNTFGGRPALEVLVFSQLDIAIQRGDAEHSKTKALAQTPTVVSLRYREGL